MGRLDGLAVHDTRRWARFAPRLLAVQHQHHVVHRLEQQAAHQAAQPPIHRLPRPEVHRQHAPAPTRARHIADRVQHLVQVHAGRPAAPGWLGQQRHDLLPFGVRQVSRVTAAPLKRQLPRAMLLGPHPNHVAIQTGPAQTTPAFSNGVSEFTRIYRG